MNNTIKNSEAFLSLKELLDKKYRQYNTTDFIENDPVSIPHSFSNKQDIETSAFLTACISWGRRESIISNALQIMKMMDFEPSSFIINCSQNELKPFMKFKHRTFNGEDTIAFIIALKNIYKNMGGLETVFSQAFMETKSMFHTIALFREQFFALPHPVRSEKHLCRPQKNSACKKMNMFLRWMVRNDNTGVDFGIWKSIPSSALLCPLDVHSGNAARLLGLLNRSQNDLKAVIELTENLKQFDKNDPVKYDFALFGMSFYEKDFFRS